jgi:4-amino-4-deoxy-L-arabinose transferase-like glycosyltransferase
MRLGGIRAGNIAGWVTAVYPGLVIYTSLAMSENLFIPLFVVALWLLIRGGQYRGAECLCAGVLIGLGTLTRSVLVAFPLVAALWLQQTNGRKNALWCILGTLLIIAPWAMRNAGYHRRFVLIDTFSGYNFLVGNNPRATGRQYLPVTDAPAQPPGAALKDDADVAAEGYREGMKFIARNPACFIVLGARKTGYLYDLEIRELAWGYSKNYFGAVPLGVLIPAAIIVAASFPLLCLCALCGLLLRCPPAGDARNGWGLLLLVIAYFTAAHFITFGESRFHLPLVPLFAILAGRLAWPAPLAPRRWRILVFIILVSLLSLNWVLRLAEDWGRVTTVFRPGGNTAEVEY